MSKARKELSHACRQVFGRDGHRSPAQQLVWEKLFKARREGPVFSRDEFGRYDETEAKLNDGARRMVQGIVELLEYGSGEKTENETKVIKE